MHFDDDLEASAFRTGGEYAWRRADALRAVRALADSGYAILGGELWQIRGREIWPGFYMPAKRMMAALGWTSNRRHSESWDQYVARSCSEAVAAISDLPPLDEVEVGDDVEVCYSLDWEKRAWSDGRG